SEYAYNMRCVARWLDYRADDVMFVPMPMMHNLNMGCCFGPMLLTGGAVAVAPNVQAETLIGVMQEFRPTWMVLFGPLVAKLERAVSDGRLHFGHVRGIVTTSGAARMRELLGAPVYQIFGMTEGVIMLTRDGDPQAALDATVGRPVSRLDSVRILVPGTEEPAAPGEIGEPVFKGPYTTHGYYRAEERNREAFTSDGHYRSGDLMQERRIDGKTFYVFCGRLKD